MVKTEELQEEEDERKNSIFEVREELMISNNGTVNPTLRRTSYFLKPLINPTNESLPKPPLSVFPSSPNLNIKDLKRKVYFDGRPNPQHSWKYWVETLQQTHENTWEKAGIFDAIRVSTYNIKRDNELVIGLAERFSAETNTFVFPWGEASITLEDVNILGGFSLLGCSVVDPLWTEEILLLEKKLVDAFDVIRSRMKRGDHVTHCWWMDYFMGKGGELEHVALLVLWLSRYVFSKNFYNIISQNVFTLAINLSIGIKIALAPAVLGAIYRDLRLLKQYILGFSCEAGNECENLVVWGLFQLVQLWGWERFPRLGPEPEALSKGEPRVARWHNMTKLIIKDLRKELEVDAGSFYWKPYATYVKNWEFPKYYSHQEMKVLLDSNVDEQLQSFARCLRPCELVGVDCVEQYLPHRVGMQFGMDQAIPNFVPRSNDCYSQAWYSYCKPLDGLKLYIPPRLFQGDVMMQYSVWWSGGELKLCRNHRSLKLLEQAPMREEGKRKEKKSSCGQRKRKRRKEERRDKQERKYVKGKVVSRVSKGSEGKKVCKSKLNTGETSKHLERRKEPILGTELNPKCSTFTEDEAANQSTNVKQVYTSVAASLIIIDDEEDSEEDNRGLKQFKELCLEIGDRLSRLERDVETAKGSTGVA
ncbi:hypothetical protein SOVF_050240 [Spinacia oleracea]|nr:hypothetical protein SOVF_050240 [Spinacia oleracea]